MYVKGIYNLAYNISTYDSCMKKYNDDAYRQGT